FPGLRHRDFRNAQPHFGSNRGRTIAERDDRARGHIPDALGALRVAARRVHRARAQPDPDPLLLRLYGLARRRINLTTSLVASVVLGLAVDNAVQFIVRFRRAQAATPELREAILESMRLSGRPIIYANVALAATFAIFFFSNFKPIASFGLLSAVTIIGCLVEDLVLLPARLISPVFRAK